MSKSRRLTAAFAITLLATVGCDDLLGPSPDTVAADEEISVGHVADDAPELISTEVSFWAVRGETRSVEIRYAAPHAYDGKCLTFVVPAEALLRRADGSVIAEGDSVQIAIRVVDPKLFLFEFDPGGLRFNPANPARIEVRYHWLSEDANGDGRVNRMDDEFIDGMAIWKQERPGEAWERMESTLLPDAQEVHASVTGFTRYALASDRQGVRLRDVP